ncbi:MAG: bifunctional diaminohydroxyphosphoribosylaminopyrimidine deaminase/5-amino-6-(5-phosphoribosylamino)uracil reductase RibD, partial [Proteobacteria bacterium]|nr:bifunctional diaminohydroxyphosphoribosylaminopyrimidine deaminase/5-amino-6-(5-phosphoribosylamino)uracil reductase RibD [Pseudomonadota bacterium]
PCVDCVIKAGVKRVVIGTKDPNPLVAGRGVRKLKRAGVDVIVGVLNEQCTALNEGYNKFITTGLPLVTLKLAATLDGAIATSSGESKWITGKESRRLVHEMRAKFDAVMVGSGTAIKDDPRLNVRGIKGSVNPIKVVIDTRLKTPLEAKVFARGAKVIIYCSARAPKKRQEATRKLGADVVVIRETKEGLSFKSVLRDMAKRGITSVMIEGGAMLAASFVKAKLVDRLKIFYAPKLIGSDGLKALGALNVAKLKNVAKVKEMKVRRVGDDILIEGKL